MSEYFDQDYYLAGTSTGKSCYDDYRWLEELTVPLVQSIKNYLSMPNGSTVLDFGCGRGYMVKAFRMIGMCAYGMDASKWAISNCDPEVKGYVSNDFNSIIYDYVVSKDVLEHIPYQELIKTVKFLLAKTSQCMFAVVPLACRDGGDYACPRDERDPSHKIRWDLATWIDFVREMDNGFIVNGSFFVPGVKQAAQPWPRSCGFLTAKRI